jgi:hypothetical protein
MPPLVPGIEKEDLRTQGLIRGLRRRWMTVEKQEEPVKRTQGGQLQPGQAAVEPAELRKEEERSLRPRDRRQRGQECRRGISRHGEAKAMVDRLKPGTTKAEHEQA